MAWMDGETGLTGGRRPESGTRGGKREKFRHCVRAIEEGGFVSEPWGMVARSARLVRHFNNLLNANSNGVSGFEWETRKWIGFRELGGE